MHFSTIRTIWNTFRNYRRYLAVLVVLGFVGALLEGIGVGAAIPLLSFLLDPATVPANSVTQAVEWLFGLLHISFTFRYLLVFIVGLFLLRAVALATFSYIRGWIAADFFYHESRAILNRLFRATWPFLLRQKLGTVQTTMVRDLQRTSSLLIVVSQSIQSFTGAFIYLGVALTISPLMTVYTFFGGGVLLLIVRPLLARTKGVGKGMAAKEKEVSHFISEHVLGMKPLKAAAAEGRVLKRGDALVAALRALQIRLALVLSFSTSLFQPFTVLFIILLFALMYQTPGFNLISFAAALYLIQKIFTYLESGQAALHAISETTPYAASFESFKRELALHSESEGGGKPFVFEREIRFKDVAFAYAEGGPVLRSVSFAVPKGRTVALIGPSGAGKTSVADLLLRLFVPTGGTVLVDDAPADSISLQEWRSRFGYVSQDPFLFNGTLEENIRFYRDGLSQDDVVRAAKEANIYDHIMSLPEGFNAPVGDRGVMLSGGQRQRVALARVLAGKPEVLVLDEATSALDQESERLIQESIHALRGKVTVFIIAHRLSTVESADHIVVLERGTVAEQGSPEELRKNPESYFARHS